jgi:hypothetical protein
MKTKSAFLPMLSLEYRCNLFAQVVLYGEGLTLTFVRYVSPDGLVAGPDGLVAGPDGLVSNLVPVAESGGDTALR